MSSSLNNLFRANHQVHFLFLCNDILKYLSILVLVSHGGAIPNSKKCVLLIFRYTEYSELKNCRQEECSRVYCLPDNCFSDERLPYPQYKCSRQICSRTSACTIAITYKQEVHGAFHDTYITLTEPKPEIILKIKQLPIQKNKTCLTETQ